MIYMQKYDAAITIIQGKICAEHFGCYNACPQNTIDTTDFIEIVGV